MMDPDKKSRLMAYTTAAKRIIFNADRMAQFLPMLNTRDGAIKAVQTVMGVIERKKPIGPDVAPLLAVNIYMLMVDMAQEIVGQKPDLKIVKAAIAAIMQMAGNMKPAQSNMQKQASQPPQQQPAQPPAGLMGA